MTKFLKKTHKKSFILPFRFKKECQMLQIIHYYKKIFSPQEINSVLQLVASLFSFSFYVTVLIEANLFVNTSN